MASFCQICLLLEKLFLPPSCPSIWKEWIGWGYWLIWMVTWEVQITLHSSWKQIFLQVLFCFLCHETYSGSTPQVEMVACDKVDNSEYLAVKYHEIHLAPTQLLPLPLLIMKVIYWTLFATFSPYLFRIPIEMGGKKPSNICWITKNLSIFVSFLWYFKRIVGLLSTSV